MRAFLVSLVAIAVIAIGAYYVLGDFQRSVQEAFATQNVRLSESDARGFGFNGARSRHQSRQ